jgi:hypothetical protein
VRGGRLARTLDRRGSGHRWRASWCDSAGGMVPLADDLSNCGARFFAVGVRRRAGGAGAEGRRAAVPASYAKLGGPPDKTVRSPLIPRMARGSRRGSAAVASAAASAVARCRRGEPRGGGVPRFTR